MAAAPREVPYQAYDLPAQPKEVFFGRAADNNFWPFSNRTGQTARRGFIWPGSETASAGRVQTD
jgi:hypothetical protein